MKIFSFKQIIFHMYKKILFTFFLFLFFIHLSTTFGSWINFWTWKIDEGLKWWTGDLVLTIENMVAFIIWLLYLISVIFWLYGWFMILTSAWEEEKVKKGRKIIIYMIIGLICIFLASSLVTWVINTMQSTKISGNSTP